MIPNKGGAPKKDGYGEVYVGADITPDAVEFGRAMNEFQRMSGTRNPSAAEVLGVLLSLGYRKPQVVDEFVTV